jgi:hypothetical protein
MLTLFSTPKPFHGQSNVIQRNALKTWTLLHTDVEVILFGDEEGTAEVTRDLGIRHESQVRRNEHGTKYLNYIFDRANEISRHDILCYANCDIMLTSDFVTALESTSKTFKEFLMIGRRWDTDITEPWDFRDADWDRKLRSFALTNGKKNGPSWIDYFCFSKNLYYGEMPPFLIGRHGWDPWLIWFSRHRKAPLVDASRSVVAVHQNHDYAYLKRGLAATQSPAEVDYNWNLGESSEWHYYSADAATYILKCGHLKNNQLAMCGPIKARFLTFMQWIWFSCLNITRPIRHRLRLRSQVKFGR